VRIDGESPTLADGVSDVRQVDGGLRVRLASGRYTVTAASGPGAVAPHEAIVGRARVGV
jgi:hypothetical protein